MEYYITSCSLCPTRKLKDRKNNIGLCWVIQLWSSPKEQWINKVKLTQFSWEMHTYTTVVSVL